MNIEEQVRQGLLKMSKYPDYLLFIDRNEGEDTWTCDRETLFGIPVIHTAMDVTQFDSAYTSAVRFIPCFKSEEVHSARFTKEFLDGMGL